MFDMKEADALILNQIMQHPLFDYYRIVDIDNGTVFELKNGRLIPQRERCYKVWQRTIACENCVSRLAVNEGRQMIKMETPDDQIFLIESSPLPELNPHLALELIKNVTDSLLIHDSGGNLALSELIRKMNDLATHDSYTGLFNKRFIEQELCRQTIRWEESKPFTIALFDIDHFKKINDTYGHRTGDLVLQDFAKYLAECAEQNHGWAGRIGGDEFLLDFPGVCRQEMVQVVEAFCQRLSEVEFGGVRSGLRISLSVGLAEYRPEIGDWKALYDLADQAMYRGKQNHTKKTVREKRKD